MSVITVTMVDEEINGVVDTYDLQSVLVNDNYALTVDTSSQGGYIALERVVMRNGRYYTAEERGSVVLDLEVEDVSFIDRIEDMSAIELLICFTKKSKIA